MHEKNFELLQEEAIRLITVESLFLTEIAHADGVVMPAGSQQRQTLDQESVKHQIEVLLGEKSKLEKQELVLAVVGTMKAGKSTTINAIVGSEILPNRNRPMTALPTLIRHRAGQKEPLLFLQNQEPLTKYIEQLKIVLETQNIDEKLVKAENREDMIDLATKLKQKDYLQEKYTGAQEIYDFLKMLNDLVRFSVITNTPFPFESYNNVDNLPAIEVEFAHLSDYGNQIGGLTLLDTPGPNEAGQEHLKPMLRDQLKKASAVLTVLDYTQLKSEADHVVRQELQQIAAECKDRLFILVNKFDQIDRNTDTAEKLIGYVAENLMAGLVKPSHVYPVSANRAYLAGRALTELSKHGTLDDNQLWVQDFAKLALGAIWKKAIQNPELVMMSADSVWQDAGFIAPLQDVIRGSHEKAGVLSLDSAVIKISDTALKLENFLEARHTGLKSSVNDLQNQIVNLKQDIEKVTVLGDEANKKLTSASADFESACTSVFQDINNKVMKDIDTYFREGKQNEQSRAVSFSNEQSQNSDSIWNKLGKSKRIKETADDVHADFDPKNTVIKFDSKDEAESLQGKIKRSLDKIIENSVADLQHRLLEHLHSFDNYLNNDLKQSCEQLILGVQTKLEAGSFKIHVRLPEFNFLHTLDFLDGVEIDGAQEQSKTKTGNRRKGGVWGTVCRWVNSDDWGWETYQYKQTYYCVDVEQIRMTIRDGLDKKLISTSANVNELIVRPLKKEVDNVFYDLTSVIEAIRADLLQSIRDHQKEQSVQDELIRFLKEYSIRAHDINLDCIGLKSDVQYFKMPALLEASLAASNVVFNKQGA